MEKGIINIKGTRNGLVICLDGTQDFDELKESLKSKIESARGFFKGAKFVFHLEKNPLSIEKTKELEDICCEHGLIPDRGIVWNPPGPPARSGASTPEISVLREPSPSLPAVGLTENDKKPCLFLQKSLRSGQKIKYDGNVVVMGDVNPGSEITATGDVIVFGSMRGVVHAGANGDENAVIMAYRLNPVQLRIASVITRPPENNPLSSYPEIARLHQGRMYIEPYLTSELK